MFHLVVFLLKQQSIRTFSNSKKCLITNFYICLLRSLGTFLSYYLRQFNVDKISIFFTLFWVVNSSETDEEKNNIVWSNIVIVGADDKENF